MISELPKIKRPLVKFKLPETSAEADKLTCAALLIVNSLAAVKPAPVFWFDVPLYT